MYNRNEIIEKLSLNESASLSALYSEANAVKTSIIGSKVYLRGLIEFSNICNKNCYYCGIRRDNKAVNRYELSDKEVLAAVDFAWKNRYGSVVLQSGEQQSAHFTKLITRLLHEIKAFTNNEVGITLSCGEQTATTYKEWFNAGAHRYLLRIETSNKELYYKLHPNDNKHSFDSRLDAINQLRDEGYQVGTGVMIGLPFQTVEDLAYDLLFFQTMNVDMVGMGPYLVHNETPLASKSHECPNLEERFNLSINMIACLRILMKNINIAASTAMQTLHPLGRETAIEVGANIVMPNLTPVKYRGNYKLYENKPAVNEDAEETKNQLEKRILSINHTIGYDQWGDSAHYAARKSIKND